MKKLPYLIYACCLFGGVLLGQNSPGEIDLEFRGASGVNFGDQTEYYEQRRTVLFGLSLQNGDKVQVGLSKMRTENQEFFEIPLLYRHQLTERLSIYGGTQVEFARLLERKSNPMFRSIQATIGVDFDITSEWDAGIQFMKPIIKNDASPNVNFDGSPVFRMRTGFKF